MNLPDSTPENSYKIDLTKDFPRLKEAPIVEAAIEIRCAAEEPWTEDRIRPLIQDDLEGYHFKDSTSRFRTGIRMEDGQPVTSPAEHVGFRGVRFTSDDDKYVCAFNREGLVVSRLEPYETWELFRDEAMRLWDLHARLGQPSIIERIGLRFINRIPLPSGKIEFSDFLETAPKPPRNVNLPIIEFLHKDSFSVPETSFQVNIVRTLQRPSTPETRNYALILDIDVYSHETISPNSKTIKEVLENMRKLKNHVFVGSITSELYDKLLKGS